VEATRDAKKHSDSPKDGKVSAKEQRDLASYASALAAGRAATVAKRWDAAERAFTEALSFRSLDSRALAERGYARLLANKPNEAERDLTDALDHGAGDRTVAGQVWFNLGLVREAKKESPLQIATAFAIANALAPSKAAAMKLHGDACTADNGCTRRLRGMKSRRSRSWRKR
jgi:hypothetical protein